MGRGVRVGVGGARGRLWGLDRLRPDLLARGPRRARWPTRGCSARPASSRRRRPTRSSGWPDGDPRRGSWPPAHGRGGRAHRRRDASWASGSGRSRASSTPPAAATTRWRPTRGSTSRTSCSSYERLIKRFQGTAPRPRGAARRDPMMPGYTHQQRAQPITLATWLTAWFWAFQRHGWRAAARGGDGELLTPSVRAHTRAPASPSTASHDCRRVGLHRARSRTPSTRRATGAYLMDALHVLALVDGRTLARFRRISSSSPPTSSASCGWTTR